MAYRLHNDLSYCLIDGHPIFLDFGKDRYFRLATALEHAFLDYVGSGRDTAVNVDDLIDRKILCAAAGHDKRPAPAASQMPLSSAMERACHRESIAPKVMLEVLALTLTTSFQLRRRTLQQNIRALTVYRRRHAGDALRGRLRDELASQLCHHASRFQYARLYAPSSMRCLPDSIALIRYLARRGLPARLVFGVMANPLSAHCWVQAGDLVLNDTVGNASAHTPIRVV